MNKWLLILILIIGYLYIGCSQKKSLDFQPIDFKLQSFDWDKKPYATSTYIQDSILPAQGNQYAAWAYSYIGNVEMTLKTWDGERGPTPGLSRADLLAFEEYRQVDAYPYILRNARDRQITIINEAHQSPQHRVFVMSLLQGMYDNGYRHLGMEGYFATQGSSTDSTRLLNAAELGYPTMKSGFYVKEPQFGNLIREALKIGFEIFGYESEGHTNPMEREINQAKNIKEYMDKFPNEKVLIHCGFAHAMEGYMGGNFEYAMAARLQEYTGIDPLTIDQTQYAEKSKLEYENAYAQEVTVEIPTILRKDNGDVFNLMKGSATVDIAVFHPRTQNFNRPKWLETGGRSFYDIDFSKAEVNCPCLVYAYKSEEVIGVAVPYDLIETSDKAAKLVLVEGDYNIVIQGNKANKAVTAFYTAEL